MRVSRWLFPSGRCVTFLVVTLIVIQSCVLWAVGTRGASAAKLPSVTVNLRIQTDARAELTAECKGCRLPDNLSVKAEPKGSKSAKAAEAMCRWGPKPKEKGKFRLVCPRMTHEFQDAAVMVQAPIVPVDDLKGGASLHIQATAEMQSGKPHPDDPKKSETAPFVVLSKCSQYCELQDKLIVTPVNAKTSPKDIRVVEKWCELKPPYPSGKAGDLELECTRARDESGRDQDGDVFVAMRAVVRASECSGHRPALVNPCNCHCKRPAAAAGNLRSPLGRMVEGLLSFF